MGGETGMVGGAKGFLLKLKSFTLIAKVLRQIPQIFKKKIL